MPESDTIRLERYRRLLSISRDLASTLDLEALLNRIIYAARDTAEAEAASILLYDDAAQELYFQVATNVARPMIGGLIVPLEGSIAGWVIQNRRPVRIQNVQEDERYFKNISKTLSYDTHSIMAAPLTTKDRVVGVLEVLNKRSGEFSEIDEDLLTVLSAQAAIAIENTRLFQQSDLVAEFVHELRTPLASLSTATYLLLRPEISREQSNQIINNIHDETLRLNTLASTFLDLARLESGRVKFLKSTFPILPLLNECKETMRARAEEVNVKIEVNAPSDMPVVEADRDRLKQVLLNLISNAVKYNYPGGTVSVRAGIDDKSWFVSVADTGMGIPHDALPNLFTKFYRVKGTETKAIGTGLGLSICKQIIQGHGGRIDVKSKVGEGTIFTVYLPRK